MRKFVCLVLVFCSLLSVVSCTTSAGVDNSMSEISGSGSSDTVNSETSTTGSSETKSGTNYESDSKNDSQKPIGSSKATSRSSIDREVESVFTTNLPKMTYPTKVGEAAGANSGIKGNIYVVDYRALCKEGALKGERYRYDMTKLLVGLQGILNKSKPVLYVMDTTESYTEIFFTYMRQKDSLLYGFKRVDIRTFDDLLKQFSNQIKSAGLIAWDESVPATVNAATTACGVDGYLPVRYFADSGSVYTILTEKYGAEVKVNLKGRFTGKGTIWGTKRASTGSAKNDAYIWAIEKYMSKTSDKYMAYAMDAMTWGSDKTNPTYKPDIYATTVPAGDYFIARSAFVFDLSPWSDEVATDDPGAPIGADYNTLIEILNKQYKKHNGSSFTQITGFPPIETKYTTTQGSKHDATASEFQAVEVFTAYNSTVDADCPGMSSMFNCSVYMHFKLKSSYKNNRPSSIPKYDSNKKYVMFYMGDCDSASWISRYYVGNSWQDENRGKLPLAFPFNPNLSDRIPVVFDYFQTTKTNNDYFIGGDSGSGYVNPTLLVGGRRKHSTLPDALNAWVNYNKKYYNLFNLSITGFVLNGQNNHTTEDLSAYSKFSPDGIACWKEYDKMYMLGEMPVIGMYETYTIAIHDGLETKDPNAAFKNYIEKMEGQFKNRSREYPFYAFRNNLCTPSYMVKLVKELKARNPEVEVVDPYTFYALAKQALA